MSLLLSRCDGGFVFKEVMDINGKVVVREENLRSCGLDWVWERFVYILIVVIASMCCCCVSDSSLFSDASVRGVFQINDSPPVHS